MKRKIFKLSIENFFSIRSVSCPVFSSVDDFIYYISNTTGTPQIWRINPSKKIPEIVSAEENGVKEIKFNPKRNEILYIKDFKGDENYQLYLLNLETFETSHITKEFSGSQCYFHEYSADGNKLLFSTNKRIKRNFDVYIYDCKKKTNILLKKFETKYPIAGDSLSNNERYYTFNHIYNNLDQDILLLDKRKNLILNVTKHNEKVFTTNLNTTFDKENKGFYYISNDKSEFSGIKYYDIKSGKSSFLINEKGDVYDYRVSNCGKEILYIINYQGRSYLRLHNLTTGKTIKIKTKKGIIRNISYNNKIQYIFESPTHPPEIYLQKKSRIEKITNSLPVFIKKEHFTESKDIYVKSFDGLKIHCLLYIPKTVNKKSKNPAIVWVHGGPESQEVHNFNKYIQILTNEGYIVIAPNYRGSTGYGKSFQQKIYKDWGGADFKDVISCLELLKKIDYVDMKRVGIGGGSFGGFMTLTCVTKSSFKFRAAVDIFGPSNLFTFLETIPEHWKKVTDILVGNVRKDKELLYERSPINFVDNISCPLFVVQGKYDPRVTENESTQIVKKLKSKNKEVEYILLDDEGHGFSKVKNQIKVFKSEMEFLNKHLK